MAGVALLDGTEYRLLISWAASVMCIVDVGGVYISKALIETSQGWKAISLSMKPQMWMTVVWDVIGCEPEMVVTRDV